MQTIHYNISDKKALSTPDKPVLVAGESGTSEIVLSSVPAAWEGFEVRALLTTPARKLVDAFAVGGGFLLTNTMLDAQGYLYIEFVAYRGDTEIDRSLPDKLYVNAGRKELGDIDPAPLPDLVAEMVAAKGDCEGAAEAAVLATERIETTDADIQAAEAIRVVDEEARKDAEEARAGFYAGFNAELSSLKTEPSFGSTALSESASVGAELLGETDWILGDGWAGNYTSGFKHAAGHMGSLSKSLGATGTKLYLVELTVDSPTKSTAFTISIGGSYGSVMYEGDFLTHTYSRAVKSISDGSFVIAPETSFDGTITNISVKEVQSTGIPSLKISDSTSASSLEVRPTSASRKNVYIGKESGRYDVTGHENAVVGSLAMRNNVSGFWNAALGSDALSDNINGSRNVAVGYLTLSKNISGHRNVAVGSMALMRNTHGINNIGIGADSVWYNTTGNYNIGIGLASLSSSVTGDYNIGIGVGALLSANAANDNIAIGCYALTNNTSQGSNIAIGNYALTHSVATGGTNLAIGYQACYSNTTGYYNYAIGRQACYCNTTGQDNFAIGEGALYFNQTGQRNVAIGNLAGKGTGPCNVNRNVFIGHNAGVNITTGGDYNTVIGSSSGVTTTTGANNILIGYNVNAPTGTTSNHLNIGNTIYGNTSTKRIGVNVTSPSASVHLPAGTSSPSTAPVKINAGTLMATPEIGAVEFDGAHLYFTDSTGTRRTIAVA